jgi:hypothetical protein
MDAVEWAAEALASVSMWNEEADQVGPCSITTTCFCGQQ